MASARLPFQSFLRPQSFHSFSPQPFANLLRPRPTSIRTLCNQTPTKTPQSNAFLRNYRLSLALALPALALSSSLLLPGASQGPLQCEGTVVNDGSLGAPGTGLRREKAESMVSVNELSFGTVAGICVGVFVKKGLKLVAFSLGGIFVLLQYFNSRGFVTINWKALTSSYDKLLDTHSAPTSGYASSVTNKSGTLGRVVARFVDFVTADVQGRATFILGMGLGFRLG